MAYGRDPPRLPAAAEILQKRSNAKGQLSAAASSEEERFDELCGELADRRKFLEEARRLGISGRYEAALNCEIAQKIKEMETIVR